MKPTRRRQVEINRRVNARAPKACAASADPTGRLILLVGPEGRGKDVLVAAARRRFAADASFAFPDRVITRTCGPNDTHVAVTRRAFQEMEASRAFLMTWQLGSVSFAVPIAARDELQAGRTVVVAATFEAVEAARAACRETSVVELLSGPDRARADLAGVALAKHARRDEAVRIEHPGDIAAAVRRFHDLLLDDRARRLG